MSDAGGLLVAAALAQGCIEAALSGGKAAFPAILLLACHLSVGVFLLLRGRNGRLAPDRLTLRVFYGAPEVLFAAGLVLFLFSFIYALNANMDYVQRFIAGGGRLRLAADSGRERWTAAARFLPLMAVDVWMAAAVRLRYRRLTRRILGPHPALRTAALPLGLVSSLLYALSFPSFAHVEGIAPLAFLCLVPLFLALDSVSLPWGIFCGTAFGVVQSILVNYWLGTFSLVSLQFCVLIAFLDYLPFLALTLPLARRFPDAAWLLWPAAWTAMDWLRSLGFLGYPWGMLGTTQYRFLALIQVSSVTGVWGVTFLMVLCNAVLAHSLMRRPGARAHRLEPMITLMAAFTVVLGGGALALFRPASPTGSIRLSLIQQNADPRKEDYAETLRTLRRLTDRAMAEKPDMVVWSETAFVPNIRRWSAEDPKAYPLAALVGEFLEYQKGLGTWLITGNDDYELKRDGGTEERLDYNGAVLFSPGGERVATYHKMHLVPFTEYFPFQKQLPGIYRMLKSFDVYLWEPGRERVVFRHPAVSFATPICFEDAFPADVMRFVRGGAGLILNLSNDYWSQTDAEAMQHAVNAMFRAVENGRPLVRASASGLTCVVDPRGRIVARAPLYSEEALTVDVPLAAEGLTLYTRWGDWFPVCCLAAVACAVLGAAWMAFRRRGSPRSLTR